MHEPTWACFRSDLGVPAAGGGVPGSCRRADDRLLVDQLDEQHRGRFDRADPGGGVPDHTGVTPTSVTIGNVTTQSAGLFTGALVGTEAYAAYVNSLGGVNAAGSWCPAPTTGSRVL